jgi:hypothetical protein
MPSTTARCQARVSRGTACPATLECPPGTCGAARGDRLRPFTQSQDHKARQDRRGTRPGCAAHQVQKRSAWCRQRTSLWPNRAGMPEGEERTRKMARPRRFERPTTAFGGRYSIQLSYGRAGCFCADVAGPIRLAARRSSASLPDLPGFASGSTRAVALGSGAWWRRRVQCAEGQGYLFARRLDRDQLPAVVTGLPSSAPARKPPP